MDPSTAPFLADYALNPVVRSNRPSPTSAHIEQSFRPVEVQAFEAPPPLSSHYQPPHTQPQPHPHPQSHLHPLPPDQGPYLVYPAEQESRIHGTVSIPAHTYNVAPHVAQDAQFAFSYPPTTGPTLFPNTQYAQQYLPTPHTPGYPLQSHLQALPQSQYWLPSSSSSHSDSLSFGFPPGSSGLASAIAGIGRSTDIEHDSDVDFDAEEDALLEGVDFSRSPDRASPGDGTGSGLSPKKKNRVTLPRGRACVACRARKLKCSGRPPCFTCQKAGLECRYEEVQRKKPRNVLLEERVVELESLLTAKGESLPPTRLRTTTSSRRNTTSSLQRTTPRLSPTKDASGSAAFPLPIVKTSRKGSAPTLSTLAPSPSPAFRSVSPSVGRALAQSRPLSRSQLRNPASTGHRSHATVAQYDIPPHSVIETTLVRLILPYTPHLSIPVHPHRFLALLSLPVSNSDRPHPALLYILFANAARVLETGVPVPAAPQIPASLCTPGPVPQFGMPPAPSDSDMAWAIGQIRGASDTLFERARTELDRGIRAMDRPLDLVRAAAGIVRYLQHLGRNAETWSIPMTMLAVACGLHRLTGNIVQPDTAPFASTADPIAHFLPTPFASAAFYQQQHDYSSAHQAIKPFHSRKIVVPPPRDQIDLSERIKTFWTIKALDWSASLESGQTIGLADDECTTEWPWGWGGLEERPADSAQLQHFGIRDLFDPDSVLHSTVIAESSYVLSAKSLCLVARANRLHDLPESSFPSMQADGRYLPSTFPPLEASNTVENALSLFRQRIPPIYAYPPSPPHVPLYQLDAGASTPHTSGLAMYDAMADPWYICLHVSLLTTEMLTFRELANYDAAACHGCIASARAIVGLAASMQPGHWVHLDLSVAHGMYLASRLLFREAERLTLLGQASPASKAAEEAEILRTALAEDCARWTPVAGMHAQMLLRFRDGLSEENRYERV